MHRVLIASFVLFAGCVPTSYAYTPASSRTFGQRPEGCEFEMLTNDPSDAFEEVGTLVHYNGDVPKDMETLKKVIAKQVCSVGGNAAIARSDGKGYNKATVIKRAPGSAPADTGPPSSDVNQ